MSGSLPIDGPGAKLRKHEGGWLLVIILGGLALRLSLLPFEGRPADISDFVGWTLTIERFGTHEFYAHATAVGGRVVNYPPGYLWVLTLIGRLDTILHAHGASNHAALRWIVKLPAIVADLGAALVVFALARRTWTSRQALLAAAILTFSPSTSIRSPRSLCCSRSSLASRDGTRWPGSPWQSPCLSNRSPWSWLRCCWSGKFATKVGRRGYSLALRWVSRLRTPDRCPSRGRRRPWRLFPGC
jgi:hypothetical protein